ncbi:pyruvate ferredoxin oxidoreductase [Candidatus Acetothermia bacterium]|jgi:pyruvate/2-oxoacid:ferredoxin oxidoreductase alpha subunit|nr:pyruvate ferredoxin oxidoreductase [Candidatus Acetothermia bacterium]MCI2432116.1 pyruvate ferredoxin oxidoreductase [Candidatus Acetothermia bacterium]MCI2436736.1 pyruvate ferredoxin oxidoreductase [Candidatus Acetothermia bacterium]
MKTTLNTSDQKAISKVITGNHAVSYGALLARAQVISAYPITPQTQVVELLSEFCANGTLRAQFIKVESEHSAMAALIGAASAGARTFTATSAHGLALMHEMLHWAAGARLPIVMANINRAMGPPWSVWTDQNDSLSQRDTGWMQFYCESNQEVLDTVIQAYKVAERLSLPAMLVLDAFVLSHTAEAVEISSQSLVDRYLPPYRAEYKLDVNDPHAFGGLATPDVYMELRYQIQKAHEAALEECAQADAEFERLFGRRYGLVESYYADDADLVLVTSGTVTSTAREVIEELRGEGRSVGLLKIRLFRPFPIEPVREALRRAKKIAVVDRNIGFGVGGIFAQEIKSALYSALVRPALFGFVAGLGGRDITPEVLREIIDYAETHQEPEDLIWVGVRV